MNYQIDDEVEFYYLTKLYIGVIADIDEDKVFIRIPSSQILIVDKKDIKQ